MEEKELDYQIWKDREQIKFDITLRNDALITRSLRLGILSSKVHIAGILIQTVLIAGILLILSQ